MFWDLNPPAYGINLGIWLKLKGEGFDVMFFYSVVYVLPLEHNSVCKLVDRHKLTVLLTGDGYLFTP